MNIIFPFLVLRIQKLESGVYGWDITCSHDLLYEDIGPTSIEDCLKQACRNLTDDVHALEVRYRSVSVGTFQVEEIQSAAGVVAATIVSRYAKTMDGIECC